MTRIAAGALALALLAAPAGAAGPASLPEDPEAALAAAAEALEAATEAPDRVAALADAVAAYERGLAGLRAAVLGSVEHERDLILELQIRRDEIARLAAVLQGMSRTARPAQRLHPQGPLAAARAEAMLRQITPALQAEAATIKVRLAAITATRAERDRGIAALETGLEDLADAREALIGSLEDRAGPEPVAVSARDAALLRDSDTLTMLATALAGPPGQAPQSEPLPTRLRWPVTGTVLRGFREPDAAGVRRPGLVLLAAPLALVTAPAAAQVRYAGPFLDYGYVVVLEPRAGLLVVLAGLSRLEVATGDRVDDGALLGLLGGEPPDAQEYLMQPAGGIDATPGQTLYMEVLQGQGSIDPAPLLAGKDG
jgi:septal ring factor EnvC (AmiA/AmiB activator)